jgi:hypothetical protein
MSNEDTFDRLDEIKKIIEEAEGPQTKEPIETDEQRVERERRLDPLHIMTPIMNDLRMEFPNLNLNPGSTNWAVVATFSNLIVALRTQDISSENIEKEIKKSVKGMYKGLYASSRVFKS